MEKSSLRVGTIMGIPIYLHFSFLLILPFLAWSFGSNLKNMAQFADVPIGQLAYSPYVWGLLLALALFASVLLHELGHSYVAMRKGVGIRGITLMLFGGVAQMAEMPSKPGEEARIALAGPVTSFLVAIACYLVVGTGWVQPHPNLVFSLSYLGHLNIFLGGFNLVPAFPMDGGRVLRSLLAKRWSFVSATRIAADVGKAFAFVFGILGLINGNLFLVLIAFFVYIGASQEYQFAVIKTTLDGFRVRDLMSGQVTTVEADTSVDALVDRMLRERHMGYPVVHEGRVVGCVTLEDVDKMRDQNREGARVADIMSTELIRVRPEDDIYLALQRMTENDIGRLLVMEDERLVGILSRSDVMHGFQLRRLKGN